MKLKLNMVGGGFQHDICSSAWNSPKHVEWIKGEQTADISIFIDDAILLNPPIKGKRNFAWLAESPFFLSEVSTKISSSPIKNFVLENFETVFTCDKELLAKNPEFKYVIPTACPWVKERQIFEKFKGISIIASSKRHAPGHQLRHQIVEAYGSVMEVMGGGYRPIENKSEGLDQFMFSFAIENTSTRGYFTEKITDCFATGTIPIYWGDPDIGDYFNLDGIITLNDDFDITSLTRELYVSKMQAIQENYLIASDLIALKITCIYII